MQLEELHWLQSAPGQETLARVQALSPSEEQFLALLTRLQKELPAPYAKAALETVLLRQQAVRKFSRAAQMYFVREALEQASSEIISRQRAQRFAGQKQIIELGCGIGGDTIGLAEVAECQAWEQDGLRLEMARANLQAYGLAGRVQFAQGDFTRLEIPSAVGLWLDPARRAGARRIFSVEAYHPPLRFILPLLGKQRLLGVKLSPGVNLAELSPYEQAGNCALEFISVAGELREAVLWAGEHNLPRRQATLLPGGDCLTAQAHPPVGLSLPLAYLYEPDPAILRAGLVELLAVQLNAHKLDAEIAYLTASEVLSTPFARAFAIEAHFPFSLKRCRAELRAREVGQITVKKRGSALDVDEFARAMRLSGDPAQHRIVFLTHVMGKPWVLLGTAIK